MTKRSVLFLSALVAIGMWLSGCEVSEKGQLHPNQPPTVELTFAPAPGDTVNHYIPLRWAGNDADGDVVAFKLTVDDGPVLTTTVRDTFLAFAAPDDSVVVPHTITIMAVDDEGASSQPASRSFYTINFRPTAEFDPDGSVPNNAAVGTGFRMTLAGVDPNPSLMTFCISIDDTNSWTCSSDSVFLFGDLRLHERASDQTLVGVDDDQDGIVDEEQENGLDDDHDGLIDEDTRGLIPDHSVMISNARLTTDSTHIIYGRVIDAGGSASPIISRSLFVQPDSLNIPALDTTVTGTYGGNELYADGSVYYERNRETKVTFSASAALYRGEINAYRYRLGEGEWSDWSTSPDVIFTDLPAADYVMTIVARDLAGTLSNEAQFTLRIVEQHLTTAIVIVDETRSGNGVPGSPSDAQVDSFYTALFAGLDATQVDYSTQGYVSPLNLMNAGVVMWHSDDRTEIKLADNTRILREFLDKGGRLIVCGWDMMAPFTAQADSATFATTSFAYRYLRAISARRIPAGSNTGSGFVGEGNYPTVSVDSTKLPAGWHGAMDRTWTFRPRGESVIIGRLTVLNSGSNPVEGRPAAYIYDLSFRVAVFGVPLYFCRFEDVYNLFRDPEGAATPYVGVVEQMQTGL